MTLYALDVAGGWPDTVIERFYDAFGDGQPLDPPPSYVDTPHAAELFAVHSKDDDVRQYANRLVLGVGRELAALDAAIQAISNRWRLARMALVDRNLLRLGAFELIHLKDEVPRKVALNEAVELAKRFGSAESRAFVNGILDRIGR